MDYKQEIKEAISTRSNLIMGLKDARNEWNRAPKDSEEESEAANKIERCKKSLLNVQKDFEYFVYKYLQEIDLPELEQFIYLGKKAISVDYSKLLDVLQRLEYKLMPDPDNNRISIMFGGNQENGLVSDVVISFVVEDIWLKIISYTIGRDIKDNPSLKAQALELLNDYNIKTRVFKAYIDGDGTIMLERQDFISNDITLENVNDIIRTSIQAVNHFYSDFALDFIKSIPVSNE